MSYFYDAYQIIKEVIDIKDNCSVDFQLSFEQALLVVVMEATKRREIELIEEQLGNYEERKRSYEERKRSYEERRNKK